MIPSPPSRNSSDGKRLVALAGCGTRLCFGYLAHYQLAETSMIETIYKYSIPVESAFVLNLPIGAKLLSVQTQRGEPCLWAQVSLAQPNRDHTLTEQRSFRLYGTGHLLADRPGTFIGTFQLEDRGLVFHLFEVV